MGFSEFIFFLVLIRKPYWNCGQLYKLEEWICFYFIILDVSDFFFNRFFRDAMVLVEFFFKNDRNETKYLLKVIMNVAKECAY